MWQLLIVIVLGGIAAVIFGWRRRWVIFAGRWVVVGFTTVVVLGVGGDWYVRNTELDSLVEATDDPVSTAAAPYR